MTIQITQVSSSSGEIVLAITYDNPSGSGSTNTYQLRKQDLVDRLIQVRTVLGRPLTWTDVQETLVTIINEVRKGQTGIPEDFDYTEYINTELES
jgi:hypothetical protein